MVAQGAARLAVVDATFESAPPTLTPRRLQTVVDYSMEQTLIAPGFEMWLMDVIMAASDRHMAAQILTGDGTAPNIRGILNVVGVLSTDYATADKGAQAGFLDAEDQLAVDVPADRRVWVAAEDLYRTARRTVRDPGDSTYVIRRWDGATRVLDNAPAIRSNILTGGYAGYGLYGEWSACTLGLWQDMVLTVDRITQPGLLKITLDRYFDFAVTRPARFSVLKEA